MTMKNLRSFTLLELMVVVIIIGVLSTMAITHYAGYRENVFDREVQANLRMIAGAERVMRMESLNNQYIGCGNNAAVNTNLRILVPTAAGFTWGYLVRINGAGTNFCAQATRSAGGRQWRIWAPTLAAPDPQPTAGACPAVIP